MRRADLAVVAALFLAALALRLHGVENPPVRILDEHANLDGAVHYWEAGQFEPDTWQHPTLRHLINYAFLRALGDNPLGWRLRNVLAGAAAVALTWLFAFHATGSRRAALVAGALLATDPLHVVLSRFTFEEITGGALFVGSVVLFLVHRGRPALVALAAALMGCALAVKWYFAPAWLLLLLLDLRAGGAWRDPRAALFLATTWTLVPAGVYLASFAPWFGRGYGLADFPEHCATAYASLQAMTEHSVRATDLRAALIRHLSAGEWFVRPIATGMGHLDGAGGGEFIVYTNDLPVWALTLPAVTATSIVAIRRRALGLALPAILFAASYALFVIVRRPAMLYSAAPLLPFAFTAIGLAGALLADRLPAPRGQRALAAAGAVLVAWNLYLYPLVTTHRVPLAPYRPVLEQVELVTR